MNNKATTNQVFKSGFSFLSVSIAIGLTSIIFYIMALNSNNLNSAIIFSGIGTLFLLVGLIGLSSKFMSDAISMGLENGKPNPSMSNINPMNVGETIRAGFDLFGNICLKIEMLVLEN